MKIVGPDHSKSCFKVLALKAKIPGHNTVMSHRCQVSEADTKMAPHPYCKENK